MIHIEGMGLLGSMMAYRLVDCGLEFTWNDIESPFTAWNASTGLLYPDRDMEAFEYNTECWSVFKGARRVPYIFAHKQPPHGGTYSMTDWGPLREASVKAMVVDVGKFVEGARERFSSLRTEKAASGDTIVQARPSTDNTRMYKWGWSAPVSFEMPDCLPSDMAQPAFYAKAHRFDMTYAYPYVQDVWLAGSSSIVQKVHATRADVVARFELWRSNAERLLGLRDIELEGPITEGWRPIAPEGRRAFGLVSSNRWVLPSLGGNGVRLGWGAVDALVEQLAFDPDGLI